MLREACHLDLSGVFLIDQSLTDDPPLAALNAVWSQIFSGSYASPAGLVLSSPSMKTALLGDLVAFLLSHGAAIVGGSGRMLALALVCLQQTGDFLAEHQRRCDMSGWQWNAQF